MFGWYSYCCLLVFGTVARTCYHVRIAIIAACRHSAGPSLRQLRVQDDVVDVDEDSNCCSIMDMSTAASSLQHAAVTVSQTDTGYQSNIMQTTGGPEVPLSTTATTASMQYAQRQHSAVDNVDSFDGTGDV